MVTVGNSVTFLSKASRSQELLHREVRELYDLGIVEFDKGKQCGACGKHRFEGIFQVPILPKFWDWPCTEIECEELSQFFDSERTGIYGDALEELSSKFPVRLVDLSQRAFVCPI
jgi:hypothetical protein